LKRAGSRNRSLWPAFGYAFVGGAGAAAEQYSRAPDNGGKWQVSTGGGVFPVWTENGRELFFETLDNRIMVADCAVKGDSFVSGKPRAWSETRLANLGVVNFDLAPDGKRIAAIVPAKGAWRAAGAEPRHLSRKFIRRSPALHGDGEQITSLAGSGGNF
jgi:hypothetical protein